MLLTLLLNLEGENALCFCRFITAYVIIAQYPHCEHIFLLFRGIGGTCNGILQSGVIPARFLQ